ncbi:hypothetical protein BDV12DRAFT_208746 [Aspergillus spectabilis]
MRFLCLHGMGTNGRAIEPCVAAIRHTLGGHHTYEWLDGSIKTEMAPGIRDMVAKDDKFLLYADDSPETQVQALTDLIRFVDEEGPFDALMGFSHGAGCLATYLLYRLQQGNASDTMAPIRCAVFFCGAPPQIPREFRKPGFKVNAGCIDIPTAHIWGKSDRLYGYGPELSELCEAGLREEVVLDGGHEIPGAGDTPAVIRCVQAIRRTLARAAAETI